MLNVLVTILETVKSIQVLMGPLFHIFDMFSLLVFTVEYLARLWVCTLDHRYSSPLLGRLKYMLSPYMLLDLAIIIPFYLPLFFVADTRFVLVLRMFRIARILKLTRYSQSFQRIIRVTTKKKDDLIACMGVVFVLLIISSSLMYYAEHTAQPDKFTSIPAAMWWGVATLTTVGYGDIFPVTDLGKFIGSFIVLLGIGMVALPTGIVGSGFLEEINSDSDDSHCPHCGGKLK
jgi:voltage-gated potassium channel